MRIERRENHGQRTVIAIRSATDGFRRDVSDFAEFLIRSREARAVNDICVERIDGDVTVLEHSDRVPLAKGDFAVVAAAHGSGRAALLLRAVNPIGEAIVRGDMVELRGRLVVPGTPGGAAIDADDRALIGRERNDVGIFRADPDALVVVAAGRAFEAYEG